MKDLGYPKLEPLEGFLKGLQETNSGVHLQQKGWIVVEIVADNAKAHADETLLLSTVGLGRSNCNDKMRRSNSYNFRWAATGCDERRRQRHRSYPSLSRHSIAASASGKNVSRWNDRFDSNERSQRVSMSLPSFPTRKPYA